MAEAGSAAGIQWLSLILLKRVDFFNISACHHSDKNCNLLIQRKYFPLAQQLLYAKQACWNTNSRHQTGRSK
jgi:hypothetical protein